MIPQTLPVKGFSYRSAGRAAIVSGIIGIMAFGFLIAYLVYRNQTQYFGTLMIRTHDAGVILQFLLMIPVTFGLHKLAHQQSPGMSQTTFVVGIGALSFTALFLLLGMVRVTADVLYMFPQGIFGVWLMIVCWRLSVVLSRGIRWFGIIVGLGLALVGTFPPAYAIFVDTILLRIPAASDADQSNIPMTPANTILHQIILIGTFGVLLLPFWTLLLGRRLLRQSS